MRRRRLGLRALAVAADEAAALAGVIGRALFVERLVLTSLFLLVASPYLVAYGTYARLRARPPSLRVSPFVYTMQ